MKKNLRWTPAELEELSIHEIAELLANIVIVLRRFPDVPVSDLIASAPDVGGLVGKIRHESIVEREKLPDWVE
jgi:hypothetical protein